MDVDVGFYRDRIVAQLAESVVQAPSGAMEGGAPRHQDGAFGSETRCLHIRMKLVEQMRALKNRS